ncbi:MAG: YlzJ-like family protein [Bacillus sp. (in: firmicutes)]
MILYTTTPPELIFSHGQDNGEIIENFYYKGVLVTAEKCSMSRYRVLSISSTDPSDYLNEELQPGSYLY